MRIHSQITASVGDADVVAWEFSPVKCGRVFLLVYPAYPLRPIHSKDGTAIVWTTIVGA